MTKLKRMFALLMAAVLCLGALGGCAGGAAKEEAPLRIVVTLFPELDWVREILGERAEEAEITLLLDSGVDLHSYQPTVDDMVAIAECDLFVYVGGESDRWVEDALKDRVNPDRKAVSLLEILGDRVKEEEAVEGMEADKEEEEAPEPDEHVWLSLRNAKLLCAALAEALGEIDLAGQAVYAANAQAYSEKLDALDARYQQAVGAAEITTLLFGDRFPFRYLADDYGLNYYAAFAGCSAETEASFETVVFLAQKVDELGLPAILQIESADGSIANTIRENTRTKDQAILTLDSLQSATRKDLEGGFTYLGAMEENLALLKIAMAVPDDAL